MKRKIWAVYFDVSGDTSHNASLLVEESCMEPPGDYVLPHTDDNDAHESLDVISETLLESPTHYSSDTSNPASLVGTNCSSHVWETDTDQGYLSELSESSIFSPSYSDLLGEYSLKYLLANPSGNESENCFLGGGEWSVLLLGSPSDQEADQ